MASTANSKPTWQTDECPTWCVVEHQEADAPEDRFHDSAARYISVTLGVKKPDQVEPTTTPAELFVVTSRRCGDHHDWTFAGEPDRHGQQLTLSNESARRLAETLLDHLDALG